MSSAIGSFIGLSGTPLTVVAVCVTSSTSSSAGGGSAKTEVDVVVVGEAVDGVADEVVDEAVGGVVDDAGSEVVGELMVSGDDSESPAKPDSASVGADMG